MKTLKATPPEKITGLRPYDQLIALARPQRELEMVQRGHTGCMNPDILGLKVDLAKQQRERPRECCQQSTKHQSSSHPRDEAKRGW